MRAVGLQRGVGNSTIFGFADNGVMSEPDDDDQHEVDDLADLKKEIEAMQFAPRRRRASVNSIV